MQLTRDMSEMEEQINEEKIVNQIRALGIDMINEAQSGHPGIVLGAAPIIYTLYAHHLRINPKNPNYYNRDRFIMSAGHGSALVYATLHMAGFDITIDDLRDFRKIDSKTPGHPELYVTPGVDMTTGPLGEGIATSVGVAIAGKHLEATYNKYEKDLFNFKIYVLCGDGDLMEGVSYEAMSLAGHLGLNNLIVLYDSNNTTLDGGLNLSYSDNIEQRALSCNWNYIKTDDSIASISNAIEVAKLSTEKPTIIEVKTVIGRYSKKEGTSAVHGGALSSEDVSSIKEKLKLRDIPFNITSDTIDEFRSLINDRCEHLEEEFENKLATVNEDIKNEITYLMNMDKHIDFKDLVYDKPENLKEAPRETSYKILNELVYKNFALIGGSADLFKPNMTHVEKVSDISRGNYEGKNIYYGIREHLMSAVSNGLAITGYRPYASTFLAFSPYLFPSMRLAAMLKLPNIYIFTHDSISIGEDGPTHQPVEQLTMLRSIPNMEVFRPADANEIIGTYKTIMKKKNSPSVISLSKSSLPILEYTDANMVEKGGYILKDTDRDLDGIIISCGEELHLALEVSDRLAIKGLNTRVVSMPCLSRFYNNSDHYIETILPVGVKKIVIEAASSMSWHKLIYNPKYLITLDEFGTSGKKNAVYKKYHFDVDSLESKIEELLK